MNTKVHKNPKIAIIRINHFFIFSMTALQIYIYLKNIFNLIHNLYIINNLSFLSVSQQETDVFINAIIRINP